MKSRTFILISILTSFFTITSNAQVTSGLKIVSGKVDTVFRASHYIVGAAKPGSEIFINGISVKQYKTGSFGMEINLVEGNNPIEVRVRNSNEDIRESFSVYYKLQSPQSIKKSVKDTLPFNGLVVTTLPGAFLNYSAGDDRLGGAKINFISEGVNMAVIDSTGDLYKVRLSENRYCFLPKEYAKKVPFGTNPPFTITGSWSVSKNDKCDRVRISLQERVPYTLSFELDPSKIIVDLYSAQCNSNWITQYLDLEAIDYVDFAQIEPDVFRVIIKLKSNKCWGYTAEYSDNSLVISVKHSPNPTLKGMVIGLDAGHGGSASGAVSPSGIKEKDLNLSMVYMLKEEFEKRGAKVVLSRKDDSDMTMAERKKIFKDAGIDMLISIHCNASGNPLVSGGTSAYYKHIEYRDLTAAILKRLVAIDGGIKNFGLVGNFNFSLNGPTDYPSVLVETLFLSSLPDEEKISDPQFRRKMMIEVAEGVEDYLKIVKKEAKKEK